MGCVVVINIFRVTNDYLSKITLYFNILKPAQFGILNYSEKKKK